MLRPFNCKSVPTCFLNQSGAGYVPTAAAPKTAQSAAGRATARPLTPLHNPEIRTRAPDTSRPHPAPRAPRSPPNRAERPRSPSRRHDGAPSRPRGAVPRTQRLRRRSGGGSRGCRWSRCWRGRCRGHVAPLGARAHRRPPRRRPQA